MVRGGAVPPTPPFTIRMLPGNVAYVALNSFGDSKAADAYIAAFPQIAKSSALIIDVRNNGGGTSDEGYRVLATLTGKPFATDKWSTRQYLPTFRAWQRKMPDYSDVGFWPSDAAHQYAKPVRVLTSASTFSSAEDFAAAYATMKRGALVGETTGGSTGQPLIIRLPGGGSARICTKRDTYSDGRPWVGIGIVPGVPAAPRIADFRNGKDAVLEAALASLKYGGGPPKSNPADR
jgi:C-terminal processing protease CtpA/Prc